MRIMKILIWAFVAAFVLHAIAGIFLVMGTKIFSAAFFSEYGFLLTYLFCLAYIAINAHELSLADKKNNKTLAY